MNLEKLKKKYKKKRQKLKSMVKVKRNSLEQELSMNPARLFSAGINKTNAEFIMGKAKANLKSTKARIKLKWSRKTVGGKKLTIPQLDAQVDSDKDVMKAEIQFLEAQYVFSLCETAVHAMKEKGQQLSNIAYNHRAEMNYGHVRESKEHRLKEEFNKKNKKNKKH